jgi:hypothetical protein
VVSRRVRESSGTPMLTSSKPFREKGRSRARISQFHPCLPFRFAKYTQTNTGSMGQGSSALKAANKLEAQAQQLELEAERRRQIVATLDRKKDEAKKLHLCCVQRPYPKKFEKLCVGKFYSSPNRTFISVSVCCTSLREPVPLTSNSHPALRSPRPPSIYFIPRIDFLSLCLEDAHRPGGGRHNCHDGRRYGPTRQPAVC